MILDPASVLPNIEWRTRWKIEELAKKFHGLTGLRLKIRPSGGRRTCETQNKLFEQGRQDTSEIVTNARGCQSWHVMGRAVDLDPVDASGRGRPDEDYRRLGSLWTAMGGFWGCHIKGFYDPGHFEWHPGLTLKEACPNPDLCQTIKIETNPPVALWLATSAVLISATAFASYLLLRRK